MAGVGGLKKKIMQNQLEQFYLGYQQYKDCIGSQCWNMSKNIWGDLLTEEDCLIVPSELRLKRKKLGLNNQEYILLLDYLDHFKHEETDNVCQVLAELNGISEETIERRLGAIEKKGLLRREVQTYKSGRIKGIIFSPGPLVKKLKCFLTDSSSSRASELDKKK